MGFVEASSIFFVGTTIKHGAQTPKVWLQIHHQQLDT